jgi:hypothetical protein
LGRYSNDPSQNLTNEQKGPKVIHEQLLAVYGDAAPTEYQVKYRSKQLKQGTESAKAAPYPGSDYSRNVPWSCRTGVWG